MKQNKTYQLGAAHERQAIKAYVTRYRNRTTDKNLRDWLDAIVSWIEERTERANKRPGGLQGRKRKAEK